MGPKAVCNDIGPLLLTASCASVWRVPKLRALCLTANIAGWSNCTDYRSRSGSQAPAEDIDFLDPDVPEQDHGAFRCASIYSVSQCSWATSCLPRLGNNKKGATTPAILHKAAN